MEHYLRNKELLVDHALLILCFSERSISDFAFLYFAYCTHTWSRAGVTHKDLCVPTVRSSHQPWLEMTERHELATHAGILFLLRPTSPGLCQIRIGLSTMKSAVIRSSMKHMDVKDESGVPGWCPAFALVGIIQRVVFTLNVCWPHAAVWGTEQCPMGRWA